MLRDSYELRYNYEWRLVMGIYKKYGFQGDWNNFIRYWLKFPKSPGKLTVDEIHGLSI